MKMKKWLSLAAVVIAVAMCFAGCGGVIDTLLTVDDSFNGQRVMTVTVSSDDLQKVTGGFEALNKVATDSLPAELTYSGQANEGGCVLTFTLSFSDIDDYKTKVTTLLAYDEENETEPEILFDKSDSIFKKGVALDENFNSQQLLTWYINAVEAAGIIGSENSKSNWCELGDGEFVVSGESYETYGGMLSVDEQSNCYLSSCKVETELLQDGSFRRTVSFFADEDAITDIAEQSDTDLAEYMSKLCPEDGKFTVDDSEEAYYTQYTYEFSAKTTDELVKKTNKIMQNENNSFSVSATVKDGKPGMAELVISECNDASFYTSNSNSIDSSVILFPNVTESADTDENEEFDTDYNFYDGRLNRYETHGKEYSSKFDWQINFADVNLSYKASGTEKGKLVLEFETVEDMDEALKNSAVEGIEGKAKGVDFDKTDSGCRITVSGKTDEIVKKLSDMLGEDGYISIDQREMKMTSRFKNGVLSAISFDFGGLVGDQKLYLEDEDGFAKSVSYILSSSDSEGKLYTESSGGIAVFTKTLNIGSLIVTALLAILLIAAVVMMLATVKSFVQMCKTKKEQRAALPDAGSAGMIQAPQSQSGDDQSNAVVSDTAAQTVASAEQENAPQTAQAVPQAAPQSAAEASADAESSNDDDEEELL